MNTDLQSTMREAMHLMKSGNVAAATEAIQNGIGSEGATEPSNVASERERTFLEGEFRVVHPTNSLPGSADAAGGAPAGAARSNAPPNGMMQFEEYAHSGADGARQYKLFVPSAYRGQPLPLLVMLHGCTQTPDDFATGTRMNELAEENAFFVAYPAQSASANVSKCWNWFKTNDQRRGQGEPAIIAAMVREILSKYSLDRDRVYVAGMSAGGAMAVVLGATYPDLFAAVGVHSGLPYRAARDLPSALAAMNGAGPAGGQGDAPGCAEAGTLPTIIFHGDRDTTVNPRNGANVAERARANIFSPHDGTELRKSVECVAGDTPQSHQSTRTTFRSASGDILVEYWLIHGGAHAWFGGDPRGTYTDRRGPDASAAMIRFFLERSKTSNLMAA